MRDEVNHLRLEISRRSIKPWRKRGHTRIAFSTHWYHCVTKDHLFSGAQAKLCQSLNKHKKITLPILTKVWNQRRVLNFCPATSESKAHERY